MEARTLGLPTRGLQAGPGSEVVRADRSPGPIDEPKGGEGERGDRLEVTAVASHQWRAVDAGDRADEDVADLLPRPGAKRGPDARRPVGRSEVEGQDDAGGDE